jgi:drug/metabolite transporter (DMT)-like permease
VISTLHSNVLARWNAMDRGARGAALVSLGSLTLVVMAMLVKQVGSHIPTIEILFFRSFIGFFFVLPMFIGNPWEPLRTQRFGMHFVRGVIGTLGNICFFWTLTHMLLATRWRCSSRGRCS